MKYEDSSTVRGPDLLLIIPIALISGCAINLMGGIIDTLSWALTMPIHETGHALIHWLRGIVAIPAPWLTLPLHQEFSIFAFLFFAMLIYILFRFGDRNKCHFIKCLAGILAVLLVIFSFFLSSRRLQVITIYSGLGGELFLSLLLILISTQDLPHVAKWAKNRLVLLGWSAFTFTGAAVSWIKISRGKKELPVGALIDPDTWFGGESNGDLDRLMRDFGWNEQYIVKIYLNTLVVCLVILTTFYAFQVYSSIKNRQTNLK